MKTALFFDLDHTLIHPKSGDTFPRDKDDWEFMPGVLDRLWQRLGGRQGSVIVVVTNQGGVAHGHQTKEDIEGRVLAICTQLRNHTRAQVHCCIAYAYDYDRKPSPGMAYKAALELELDLAGSTMVGDMATDEEFAKAAGIGTFIWASEYFKPAPAKPYVFMGPLKLDHNPIG